MTQMVKRESTARPRRRPAAVKGGDAKPSRRPSQLRSVADREAFQQTFDDIVANIETVIKGKTDVVRMMMVALIAGGHVLLEDMPGTGKTMMARAISQSLAAQQSRLQCTPDLLPSDVTGAPIFDQRTGTFSFRPGPVFANVLLVDEVNRATPKTQSALLEAMQERQVSVNNETYPLPKPFIILATQNPVELAGTFPLPEAQLDRFMLKLSVGYPNRLDEVDVLEANAKGQAIDRLGAVVDIETVIDMMAWAQDVTVSRALRLYIVDLCQATRSDPALMMGASSRASQALQSAARVLAASQARDDALPDDVKRLVRPVLAHRLQLSPDALLRGETVEAVVDRILASVRVPVDVDEV